jgi:hypothetical protein
MQTVIVLVYQDINLDFQGNLPMLRATKMMMAQLPISQWSHDSTWKTTDWPLNTLTTATINPITPLVQPSENSLLAHVQPMVGSNIQIHQLGCAWTRPE